MILSKREIAALIEKQKLVSGALDLKHQLQPASIDLTVEKVFSLAEDGSLDFDNSERVIPKTTELPFDDSGWVTLAPGTYKIRFNEAVKLPADIAALTTSRSSLARCGCLVHVGWWDPGYEGRGEACLVVGGKGLRLRRGAKVAQMIFIRMSEEASELYAGIHQKENLKKQ
ncbi:MAG: deoxyuridine 5'-triphosphate nucleotidohydrolase [Candidatus Norongarragalinales archaeon]